MRRELAFTVDLDRDVNMAMPGRRESGSKDCGQGCGPRFCSSAEGLRALVDLLDELGMRATFFAESCTLGKIEGASSLLDGHEVASHAVHHEDLTGKDSGLSLDDDEVRGILRRSMDEIKDITGTVPKGFRAPYQHADGRILDLVSSVGFLYDSSMNRAVEDGRLTPRRLDNGLWEFPVAEGRDRDGRRIVAYLWPMHEGRRGPDDYKMLMDDVREGTMVMATHSWHMAETFSSGPMSAGEREENLGKVRAVLEHARDQGMECVTLSESMDRLNAGR